MGLKFEGIEELQDLLLDKTLEEADLSGGPSISGELETEIGDVTLKLEPEAKLELTKFSKSDDEDPDGIIGVPKETDVPTTEVKPQIHFESGSLWIKYKATLGVSGSAELDTDHVGAGFEAGVKFGLADYRPHRPDEKARDAVLHDLSDPRFALVLEDVLQLTPGEALAFRAGGNLSASLALKWSEIATSGLSGLSEFVQAGSLISLTTSVSAAVDFKVTVSDDFILVFTRDKIDSSLIRVAVRKADSTSTKAGVALKVGVGFSDPSQVESAILDSFLPAVVRESVDKIDGLLAKASLDDLGDIEKRLLQEVFKRAGLDDVLDSIESAKKAWEDFKKKLTGKVKEFAKAKVEAALTYTYLRTRTESTLLQALLTEAQVSHFHGSLVRKDVSGILDRVRQDPRSIKVEEFLMEDKVVRVRTLGFSLGIGPWKAMSTDTLKDSLTTQENLDGDQRLAYAGSRSYFGQDFDSETVSFTVDFNAEMKDFRTPEISADAFEYGLAFDYLWDESRSLTENNLDEILDYALVWNVIKRGHLADIHEKLAEHIRKESPAKAALSLKFPHGQFTSLRAPLRNELAGGRIFLALGRAMPRWRKSRFRRDLELRQKLYAPLWKFYFDNPGRSVTEYAKNASSRARDFGSDLQLFEVVSLGGAIGRGNNRTFASVIEKNGQTIDSDHAGIKSKWQSFVKGFETLDKAIQDKEPYGKIEDAFAGMVRFWSQHFFLRTLGCYMVNLADVFPHIGPRIERSLSFTIGEKVIAFGSPKKPGSAE